MPLDFGYFEEEQLGRSQDAATLWRLVPFARPYAQLIAASILLVILITACELAIPYMTKIAVDRYIVPGQESQTRLLQVEPDRPGVSAIIESHPELFATSPSGAVIELEALKSLNPDEIRVLRAGDMQGLGVLTGLFCLLIGLNFGLNFFQKVIMEYTGQQIMHDLRMGISTHILNLSLSFFNRHPVGRLVTRASNDVQNMHELFTNVISFVLKDMFMLLGIAVILLTIHWQLALVSFAVLPFVLLAATIFARKARDVFRTLRIKVAEINSRFSETIEGIRIIQLFRQEKANSQRFARLNHENYEAGMRQIRILAVFMPVIEALGFIAIAAIISYGGGRVLQGSLSLGALVAFLSYIRMFFRPIRDMAEKFNLLQNAMASAERIFQILDTPSQEQEKPQPEGGAEQEAPIRDIEFRAVSFAYNSKETVLRDVSFKLSPGEHIAFVGPTGAGKTSLINLMTRFFEPTAGQILINSRDIREWDLNHLRSRTALVMQESLLLSRTVRETLLQGNPDLNEEAMDQILRESLCQDLVRKLPQGLDTVLAGYGGSISTGERQLLSIARAMARDPDLLILDEATSSIDSETEQTIQLALERLMHGRSSITIAHRLATARKADRIYVLNKARIVESGAHQELLARQGLYARMQAME